MCDADSGGGFSMLKLSTFWISDPGLTHFHAFYPSGLWGGGGGGGGIEKKKNKQIKQVDYLKNNGTTMFI
jgi:hypothetical protein